MKSGVSAAFADLPNRRVRDTREPEDGELGWVLEDWVLDDWDFEAGVLEDGEFEDWELDDS